MTKAAELIFGAGKTGRKAYVFYKQQGKAIDGFIDNASEKQNGTWCGLPVFSLQKAISFNPCPHIIVACYGMKRREITSQLESAGITDYEMFNEDNIPYRERIISYCHPDQLEDVILYHALRELDQIFYIDAGANDPVESSVTKLFYDIKNAKGINIEPLEKCCRRLIAERKRDITLNVGVGERKAKKTFYIQSGGSTVEKENIIDQMYLEETIEIQTLKDICERYIQKGQEITFLKVDVEGFEKEVLLGADFDKYRPYIIVMEATIPRTKIWCYEKWESILLEAGYKYVYTYGVNRYYIAKEHAELENGFLPMEELKKKYDIYTVRMEELI